GRYERTGAGRDTRAGRYRRKLGTQAGEVELKTPKLREQTFETAIIERYWQRESSVEEALIEMHLAGVSVRRYRQSPKGCGARMYRRQRCRTSIGSTPPIEGLPHGYLDGIVLKRIPTVPTVRAALGYPLGVTLIGVRLSRKDNEWAG